MRELIFGIQERITVQRYVSVVYTLASQSVAHPFASHSGRHQRHDVPYAARQFEHDHHQRDGHPRNAAEDGGRAHHRVQSGRYAIVARRTFAAEQPILRIIVRQLLHGDADDATGDRAQTQTRYEETARHFHAEREDRHDELQDQS